MSVSTDLDNGCLDLIALSSVSLHALGCFVGRDDESQWKFPTVLVSDANHTNVPYIWMTQ